MSDETLTIGITAAAIKSLGGDLYRRPFPALVRELTQNAIDACLGVDRTPVVSVEIKMSSMVASVVVTDNGIGMSKEDIVNNFLFLGGSKKVVSEANKGHRTTGGKGLAKMALFRCDTWSVETRDNYVVVAGEDSPIEFTKLSSERLGTRVEANYGKVEQRDFEYALAYIMTSDISVTLVVTYDGHTERYDNAGSSYGLKGLKEIHVGKGWVARATATPLNLRSNHRCECAEIYRTNGLTQLVSLHPRNEYGDGWKRGTVVVYDIEIPDGVDPKSWDYPYTASREQIRGNVGTEISAHKDALNVDYLSAKERLEERRNETRYVDGNAIISRRLQKQAAKKLAADFSVKFSDDQSEYLTDIAASYGEATLSKVVQAVGNAAMRGTDISKLGNAALVSIAQKVSDGFAPWTLRDTVDGLASGDIKLPRNVTLPNQAATPEKKGILCAFKNYNFSNKKNVKRDGDLLRAWRLILEEISLDEGGFGIGLDEESWEIACRETRNGVPYYIFNPRKVEKILDSMDSWRAKAVWMWQLATHEITHREESTHNENFASIMLVTHTAETADIFFEILPKLKEYLA